jgi:hypothetical protein
MICSSVKRDPFISASFSGELYLKLEEFEGLRSRRPSSPVGAAMPANREVTGGADQSVHPKGRLHTGLVVSRLRCMLQCRAASMSTFLKEHRTRTSQTQSSRVGRP